MRNALFVLLLVPWWVWLSSCDTADTSPDDGGVTDDASGVDTGTPGSDGGPDVDGGLNADSVRSWVDAYAAAHPGREGDINELTPSAVAGDPDAERLLAVCGADQRPIYPRLAWEYGGSDQMNKGDGPNFPNFFGTKVREVRTVPYPTRTSSAGPRETWRRELGSESHHGSRGLRVGERRNAGASVIAKWPRLLRARVFSRRRRRRGEVESTAPAPIRLRGKG